MSTIGLIRTSRQFYAMAMEPLIAAEAHALAGRPLKRREVEDAIDSLQRPLDALRNALAADNVVRPEFGRSSEAVVRAIFDTGALIGVPTINDPTRSA